MKQLIEKVAHMRRLQKEYFRQRSSYLLQQCKKAEKEVDLELARIAQAQVSEQKTLKF